MRAFVNWQQLRQLIPWTGLVLFIFGAKLWLIDTTGSSLPVWDQIDGEGENAIRPWLEDRLTPADILRPHNEHRIVLTKLSTLALTAINQQWDSYVTTVFNALIHALFVPVFLLWIRQRITGIPFAAIAAIVTALWILPLNWENTLNGFQSQFYFLIWLTFLHLAGVLGSDRFSWKWGAGQGCGLLALGAMGSGLMSSIAVLMVVGWDCLRQRRANRFQLTTLGLSLLWILIGWISRTQVPGHDPLRAESLGEVITVLGTILVWPTQAGLPFTLLFAVPLIWTVVTRLRSAHRDGFDRTFVGLAIWFAGIAATIAIYRNHGSPLSSRYLDQFALGLVLQGVSLALIAHSRWRTGLLTLWVAVLALSFTTAVQHTWRTVLQNRPADVARQEANVRHYLATQDPASLLEKPESEIPHPSGAVLVERWQHASIQQVMPAAVRAPVAIPAIGAADLSQLPPAPYPIIASSPAGSQIEPWTWRSARQSADTLPVLRFRINGGLGDPEAALSMRIVSDLGATRVVPDGSARNRWKTINVFRPAGEWWIELNDSDGAERIALTAPVELGWLSWFSEKLLKYHRWFVSSGLALLFGGILASAPTPPPSAVGLGRQP
jgi:hypothetical protein